MNPRIIDIAREAEVSQAAVSMALNNKSGVSEEVRQKIIRIAKQKGYKNYNQNNRTSIMLIKIGHHGHIINKWHDAFISGYLEGIETGAKNNNIKSEVSFFNLEPIEKIIASVREASANGFIVLGTELSAQELNCFTQLSKPVVFIDTYFPLSACDCIDMDNIDCVFKAIQYLYTNGHRRIGLIKGSYGGRNFRLREFGFREAMEYFSLPVDEELIISLDPAYEQTVIDMKKFLKAKKPLPTAFFCMNDILAYGCMKALRLFNYNIPGDISIIGFDDLPSSSFSDPPLTTIQLPLHQIGQRALEKLLSRINSAEKSALEYILISGELIVRDSVRKI